MNKARWPIPSSWAWAPAGEIAEVVGGGTPPTKDPSSFSDDGIRWITPADLTGFHDVYIEKGARDLSEKGFRNSSAKLMPKGAVLFSSRAPIGYCAIAAGKIATNQGFKSLVLNGDISPEFIRLYLLSAKDYAESMASGTTFCELSGSRMAKLPIPVPPPPEQRRIVAKLDRLSARSRAARDHLARTAKLAARAKQAILARLIDDAEGGRRPLRDLVRSLDQGWSPKCEPRPALNDEEWAVIKTTSIQAVDFRLGENKALPLSLKPRPELQINEGDVLVTRAGPRSRVAITCLVRKSRARLMLCDKAYRLRTDPKRAVSAYLAYALNTPQSLAALEELKTGISDSGLNLTQSRFLALTVPGPSIDEQESIVRRIETAFARIDRLTAEAARAAHLLDLLDERLLAKAFRGELVPQDPADEPAEALLERAQAARASAPKARRGRRARAS